MNRDREALPDDQRCKYANGSGRCRSPRASNDALCARHADIIDGDREEMIAEDMRLSGRRTRRDRWTRERRRGVLGTRFRTKQQLFDDGEISLDEYVQSREFSWRCRGAKLRRRPPARHPECTASYCRGADATHRNCNRCGTNLTCNRGLKIDQVSLKRGLAYFCDDCSRVNALMTDAMRTHRTERDYKDITTPVNPEAIIADQMADQFPSRSREAIRAFAASGARRATVPQSNAGTLNASLRALGLDGRFYAEQRSDSVVLRRVQRGKR